MSQTPEDIAETENLERRRGGGRARPDPKHGYDDQMPELVGETERLHRLQQKPEDKDETDVLEEKKKK